jgi:protein SCO1
MTRSASRVALARRFIAAAAIGVLALAAASPLTGCALVREAEEKPPAARIANVSLFRFPWTWTDELGRAVTFARWRGQPLVVSAIYTSCRATCPRTLQKMRELYASFDRSAGVPQFLLVTIDPTTDTPEKLKRFKQSEGLPDSWHLLAGTVPETRELADFLDIHIVDMDSHLLHDGRIVEFDAQGMPTRAFGGWGIDDETVLL